MVAHETLIHLGVRKHLSFCLPAFSNSVSASLDQPRTELRLLWQLLIWHLPNYSIPTCLFSKYQMLTSTANSVTSP